MSDELSLFGCPSCQKKLREVKGKGIDGGKCPSCRTKFRVRDGTLVECSGENGYFPFFTVVATKQDLEHQKRVREIAKFVEMTSRLTPTHVM